MSGRTAKNGTPTERASKLKKLEREMKDTDRRTKEIFKEADRVQRDLRKLAKR